MADSGKGRSVRSAQEREKKISSRNKELEISSMESGAKVPQATDIEEAVLGAMMLDPDTVIEIIGSLSDECFYNPRNRMVFKAISALNNANKSIDILTVAEQLKANGDFDEVGGSSFLADLTSRLGAAAHVDYYVGVLVDKYIQRKLISISLDTLKNSYDDSQPVDELLNTTQQKLFELAERNMSRETQKISKIVAEMRDDLEDLQTRPEGHTGLASGYSALDRVTYGWQKSDLVIIAARPSMGKTAFVLTMARNMAVEFGTPVAFFSLEQSPKQLIQRLAIAETGIESDKLKGGKKMTDADWMQLDERINRLEQSPLYIDDTPALSISDFRAKARKLVQGKGVKIIIIDYLQLMTGSRELKGNREQEVAEISRSLKAVAKELDVPVVALAQLSRAAETQGGQKKPQLTHLRESGAIEQDADIVLFIHRPEYYGVEDNNFPKGYTEIIIAKHRNGETKDVPMKFLASQMKFVDINDHAVADYIGADSLPPVSFSSKINSADFSEDEEDYNFNAI